MKLTENQIKHYENMTEEELQNLSEAEFLLAYHNVKKKTYEKASNTVDMVIFTLENEDTPNKRKAPNKKLQTMLIKRGGHPFKNHWAIAGGFVNMDEDLDTAVKRELKEETGLDNVYAEQLYTWSEVNRDPRMRVISSSYMALLPKDQLTNAVAGDDALEVAWFDIQLDLQVENIEYAENKVIQTKQQKLVFKNTEKDLELSAVVETKVTITGTIAETEMTIIESNGLAFDHPKILLTALERLQGKLEYTNIAFNLMSAKFTLGELQRVYEAILGRKLYKSTFRKRIEPMVLELNEMSDGVWHKPSKLYKYNVLWKSQNF